MISTFTSTLNVLPCASLTLIVTVSASSAVSVPSPVCSNVPVNVYTHFPSTKLIFPYVPSPPLTIVYPGTVTFAISLLSVLSNNPFSSTVTFVVAVGPVAALIVISIVASA